MKNLIQNEEVKEEISFDVSHLEVQVLQKRVEEFLNVGCSEGEDKENEEAEDGKWEELDVALWEVLVWLQGRAFQTAKGLEFTYYIKGNEMFVSRKDKSLTRATVMLAFHTALMLQRSGGTVSGPKKLKTFGASYLYPVFQTIGVIR